LKIREARVTTMRKLFIIGLVVAVAAGAASIRVSGSSAQMPLFAGTLYVCPDSTWRSEGEVFQIGVCVSAGITELMGYNVAVTFDSSVIEILDVEEGSLPRSASDTTFFWWFNAGVKSDSVHVNGAVLGGTVDGPGELFTLTFKALTHGVVRSTIIRVACSDLRDGTNHPIDHEKKNGFVAVEPTVPSQRATWGAVKDLYR
jgi:hypothetical protein